MKLGKVGSSPELPLFRGIVCTKLGEQLRKKGGISYTRVRELVLQKLTALGLDPKQFGLHSLRSGGASAAANAGVPDRLFKRHGCWRSENAKDGYVKDTMEAGCLCHRILVCELNTNLDKLLFSLFHILCSLTLHMGG